MKKLLFSCLALASVGAFAQTANLLEGDNYESYTLGNVGSDTTGATAGQGGMFLLNGTAADYQIAQVDAAHGKSLQITGGATAATASNRNAYKSGVDAAWAARTAGNDFLVGSLEIYTGTATGAHRIGSAVYGTDNIGIVGVTYNSSTKTINGLARLDNGAGTVAFYNITGLTTATFPANTWIKVGYSYDFNTGTITYTINGTTTTLSIAGYTTPASVNAGLHSILMPYVTNNAATMTAAVDNYSINASSTAVLGVKTVGTIDQALVSIYPNPTSDFLKFSGDVKSVEIFDVTGKLVNAKKVSGNKVDVNQLKSGMYMIKMETANGTQTEKFIKK